MKKTILNVLICISFFVAGAIFGSTVTLNDITKDGTS